MASIPAKQSKHNASAQHHPRFAGMIAPETLFSLVQVTAPYIFEIPEENLPPATDETPLIDLGAHPLGFVQIIRRAKNLPAVAEPSLAQQLDYFALCVACHHGTVATFVPTDVDSKIRGTLWHLTKDADFLLRQFEFTLQAMQWSLKGFSTRCTELAGVGPVSGHDGEMLGVLAGALGAFITIERADLIDRAITAIESELSREAQEFNFVKKKKGFEIPLLCIAASLTHNIGDLDQGIKYWGEDPRFIPYREKLEDFNHLHGEQYDSAFAVCLKLYKALMATEGHRHYPLREIKALRNSPQLLLPIGPFLDSWGGIVAKTNVLTDYEKAEVLSQMLQGCANIKGQVGYFRAINGMAEALGGRFQKLADLMPKPSRILLKDNTILQHLKISRESFEASIAKKTRAMLGF